MKKVLLMKKVILAALTAAVIISAMAISGAAFAAEPLKIVLAHNEAADTTRDKAMHFFSDRVKELTNGGVDVEVYPGGQLGDWRECVEGLSMGVCNIVCESVGAMQEYSKLANVDAIPYLYKSIDHWYKVAHSELKDEILDAVGKDAGFKLLSAEFRGVRITTSVKPFRKPEEVKGLKIRVPSIQVYIDTWADLGAVTTPLSLNEVYTAITQGTVEAQENPLGSSYGFGMAECCKNLVLTNHVMSFDTLIFDADYFAGLPEDVQKALATAADEAAEFRWKLVLEEEDNYIKKFRDAGCEVIEPDIDAFVEFFKDFADKHYPDLADWINKIKAMS